MIRTESVHRHKISFGLCFEAHSTSRVVKEPGCGVGDKIKTTPALPLLGVSSSAQPAWTGSSFYQWVGMEGESPSTSNVIPILALGRSYVPSARSLEMHGQGSAGISYTLSTAIGYGHDAGIEQLPSSPLILVMWTRMPPAGGLPSWLPIRVGRRLSLRATTKVTRRRGRYVLKMGFASVFTGRRSHYFPMVSPSRHPHPPSRLWSFSLVFVSSMIRAAKSSPLSQRH